MFIALWIMSHYWIAFTVPFWLSFPLFLIYDVWAVWCRWEILQNLTCVVLQLTFWILLNICTFFIEIECACSYRIVVVFMWHYIYHSINLAYRWNRTSLVNIIFYWLNGRLFVGWRWNIIQFCNLVSQTSFCPRVSA